MKCSRCSKEIKKGPGKMLIRKSGKISYFCSSKCEKKAIKFKKSPKDLKWVTKSK